MIFVLVANRIRRLLHEHHVGGERISSSHACAWHASAHELLVCIELLLHAHSSAHAWLRRRELLLHSHVAHVPHVAHAHTLVGGVHGIVLLLVLVVVTTR